MHNAALRALGLDWVYLALPLAAAELAGGLRALEALDCRGLNVTLPHKRAVADLAAELCPLARRLGAVNTLVRRSGGGWFGTNTDVEGFLAPLAQGIWQGRRALVLGCGGSALAVLAGLERLGLAAVQVAGRDPQRLGELVASCRRWLPQLQPVAWNGRAEDGGTPLMQAVIAADLVVNTTPVGMASRRDPAAAHRCPLGPAALECLRPEACVYDLIYTPRTTALLAAAAARGCRTINGLEMLVCQGAASLSLWSGCERPPLELMRQAALRQLEAS